jgi:hypothetical protein
MADVDDGAEVSFDIDASEAFQKLAESIVRIDRVLVGIQALAETAAVSQDLLQREQLTNRALMKQLLEKYQLQDAKIAALVKLVDSHQAALQMATPAAGRAHDA